MKDVPPHAVGDASTRAARPRCEHGVLAHQLPGARQPQARADAGPARAPGHQPRRRRRRADPAGAPGPRHARCAGRCRRSTWTTRPRASASSTIPPGRRPCSRKRGIDPTKLQLTLDTPSGRYPLDKDISLAIAAQLQRIGIKVNVVVNEWGTHLDKIKNRTTGDMFFLGWGPALEAQGTIEPLFQGRRRTRPTATTRPSTTRSPRP